MLSVKGTVQHFVYEDLHLINTVMLGISYFLILTLEKVNKN